MIDKIYEAPTRYYTNRESRRASSKRRGSTKVRRRPMKVVAINEIVEPKTPVSLGEVFRMMVGKTRH